MGLKIVTTVIAASLTWMAAVAASVPLKVPGFHGGESASAVLAGAALLIIGTAIRRDRVIKH
jgi:hypothetical protein